MKGRLNKIKGVNHVGNGSVTYLQVQYINTRDKIIHTMNLLTKNSIYAVVAIVAIGTSILASIAPAFAEGCVSCIIHPSESVKFTCEGTGPGGTLEVKMKAGETKEIKCLPRS